jgi:hypothetical protein
MSITSDTAELDALAALNVLVALTVLPVLAPREAHRILMRFGSLASCSRLSLCLPIFSCEAAESSALSAS